MKRISNSLETILIILGALTLNNRPETRGRLRCWIQLPGWLWPKFKRSQRGSFIARRVIRVGAKHSVRKRRATALKVPCVQAFGSKLWDPGGAKRGLKRHTCNLELILVDFNKTKSESTEENSNRCIMFKSKTAPWTQNMRCHKALWST